MYCATKIFITDYINDDVNSNSIGDGYDNDERNVLNHDANIKIFKCNC